MKNNKGFFLAETIVTTTILVFLSINIYIFTSQSIKSYNQKYNYETPKDIYRAYTIKNYLYEEKYIDNILDTVDSNGYFDITDNNYSQDYNFLKSDLQIIKIIVSEKETVQLKTDSTNYSSYPLFEKYIKNLDVQADNNINGLDFYRLIVAFNDNTFVNIKILKDNG